MRPAKLCSHNKFKSKCNQCHADKVAKWNRKNPERAKEIRRNSYHKRYPTIRHRILGSSKPTRDMPIACEACGKLRGNKILFLDHDHKTGKFRGWLCLQCNSGIGMLGDNMEGLVKAMSYLSSCYK